MLYSVIGLMSGSSMDGLDIVYVQFNKNSGKWTYEILNSDCYPYPGVWVEKLSSAANLSALDYLRLHSAYGHYLGSLVNRFINENNLQYKVQLIGSHGHTVFHVPEEKMTSQLGDGAAIAATTGINVISDLRSMDIAFGGQGAPIVPIGERLLFTDQPLFLNLGGIANISAHRQPGPGGSDERESGSKDCVAFDICPANRVLNLLASHVGKIFDEGGVLAGLGAVNEELLAVLNAQQYYFKPYPKSLANNFGTDTIYPIIRDFGCTIPDALRTYTEHICIQVSLAIENIISQFSFDPVEQQGQAVSLMVTGGGAFNLFLINRLKELVRKFGLKIIVPEDQIVKFKEAIIMALMAALRWREESNVLSSVTGAVHDSIGGAVWIGQQA